MRLELRELSVRLGRRDVLTGITAVAAPGTVTAVVGPNAAGKSTLLRAAAGLVPVARGTVRLGPADPGEPSDAADPADMRPAARAAAVAWVPARPDVALPFTVRQVVAMGRHAVGRDPVAVDAAIHAMDLDPVAEQPWPTLSTGQQQRTAIARSLAQRGRAARRPGLWLLDEPASALDLRHVARLGRVIRAEAGAGAAVVLAIHDLGLAADWADAAWILDAGRLVAAGPVAEAMTPERLEPVFGVPLRWIDDGGRPRLIAGA